MSNRRLLPRTSPVASGAEASLHPVPGQRVIVVGVGNPWRRDDGVGPAAVEALRASELDGVDLATTDGELTRLVELWQHRRLAIIIDAVVARAEPGTIHALDTAVDTMPDWSRMVSSHRAGLAEAVALARTLDRLPDRLLVFGVEPADVAHGSELSLVVAASMPALLARVSAAIRSARVAPSPPTAAPREGSCT